MAAGQAIGLRPGQRLVSSFDVPVPNGSELASLFADGDERALERAYDHWGSMVYGYACSRLGPGDDAEAVTVQVFVSAWRLRAECSALSGSMAEWVLGIARLHVEDVCGPTRLEAPRHSPECVKGRKLRVRSLASSHRDGAGLRQAVAPSQHDARWPDGNLWAAP